MAVSLTNSPKIFSKCLFSCPSTPPPLCNAEGKLHSSKLPGVKPPLWVLSTILMRNKELSHPKEKKKWTLRLITPSPSQSSLWLVSKIPCPSRLRDNYSEQLWRRTGPLKTVALHIHAYINLLFSWVSAAELTNLTAAPSRLIKGDLWHIKVPVSFFFQTSPSLAPLPSRCENQILSMREELR